MQRQPGRLRTAERCQSAQVPIAILTGSLLCQNMMACTAFQQSVLAGACSTWASSPESLFSPSWVTDKMLQWQQKSGQAKHTPCWNGRKALVTRICSLWTSKGSRAIFSLLLTLVTEISGAERLEGSREAVKAGRRNLNTETNSSVHRTDRREFLC